MCAKPYRRPPLPWAHEVERRRLCFPSFLVGALGGAAAALAAVWL